MLPHTPARPEYASGSSVPAVESDWFDRVPGTRFDRVTWFPEIGSTNTELIAAARRGEAEGRVLIADLQTAGRGRRGRRWSAPPGTSLMMSVLLRPRRGQITPANASLVTSTWASCTVASVAALTGVTLGVKWPNDLVVEVPKPARSGDLGYRKVAGILTESVLAGGEIGALVVGMGLNTGWPEVPTELEELANSLNLLARAEVDRPRLAREILTRFDEAYEQLLAAGGVERALERAKDDSATIGRRVRVELASEEIVEGVAVDLSDEGHLVVDDGAGRRHSLAVGDVIHLRPGGI